MSDIQARLLKSPTRTPWNKGKLIGAKPPLRPKHVWSIRTHLMIERRTRPRHVQPGHRQQAARLRRGGSQGRGRSAQRYTIDRATIRQRKTGRPVKFELTDQTREAVDDYLRAAGKKPGEFLFTGSGRGGQGMTTRQYARLVFRWVASIGLDAKLFGTHSLRRTKATLIYRRTGNLRAVQLLLGHTKIESTVRYLGIEVDDALAIAEQTEV